MKVTKAEIVRGKEPILLPQPWLAAWCEPDGTPVTCFDPPILTPANHQAFVHEQILVGADGCVPVLSKPGLGITLRQDWLA